MTLRLLCDEHVGGAIHAMLDSRFDTERVVDSPVLGPSADDTAIWRYADENGYVVFTNDRHFVDGTANPEDGTYPGVILYTVTNWKEVFRAVCAVATQMSQREIEDLGRAVYVPGSWT